MKDKLFEQNQITVENTTNEKTEKIFKTIIKPY